MGWSRIWCHGGFCDGSMVSCLLPAVGCLEDFVMGGQVHGYVIKQGLECDKFMVSAMIDMYGKCGYMKEMCKVFDAALEVFRKMMIWGLVCDFGVTGL